jgi:hypothetical protein
MKAESPTGFLKAIMLLLKRMRPSRPLATGSKSCRTFERAQYGLARSHPEG